MLLLENYLLLLVIICLWYFGLVPTIRYVFKAYLNSLLQNTLEETPSIEERQNILKIHKFTTLMLSNLTFRELLVLLPISKDLAIIAGINEETNSEFKSSHTYEYAQAAFKGAATGLYCCTLFGFLRLLSTVLIKAIKCIFVSKFDIIKRTILQPATLMVFIIGSLSTHLYMSSYSNPATVLSTSGMSRYVSNKG